MVRQFGVQSVQSVQWSFASLACFGSCSIVWVMSTGWGLNRTHEPECKQGLWNPAELSTQSGPRTTTSDTPTGRSHYTAWRHPDIQKPTMSPVLDGARSGPENDERTTTKRKSGEQGVNLQTSRVKTGTLRYAFGKNRVWATLPAFTRLDLESSATISGEPWRAAVKAANQLQSIVVL